ncbi:hypothetical protein BDL97_14G104400 [Sphagnum fallax]|nr:hypothetical protein BDL97_14G104400 [Sphagnum fallax]
MSSVFHLISIGPSHYCEKARWALERAGVIFQETKHMVVFHIFYTRGLGGGTSCPKLVMQGAGEDQQLEGSTGDRIVLQESTDILKFADRNIADKHDRLYPDDPELLKLVESWESKFGKNLGPNVRRWAYSYLLYDKSSYHLMTQGASITERIFAWILMPLIRPLIGKNLKLDRPGTREKSLAVVESIFKEVGESLANGHAFICGDRFTAADLTFAALGGPMVVPPEYGAWAPSIEECPKEMASTMLHLRDTAAGKHILKMYETERNKVVYKQSQNH